MIFNVVRRDTFELEIRARAKIKQTCFFLEGNGIKWPCFISPKGEKHQQQQE